jgi:cytochrome c-type biogenesis protein
MGLSLGIVFLAGLASFLTPCVFSLVPAYVGYLGGRSAAATQTEENSNQRWITFTHGLAFVLGFSIVFILLGVAASALSGLLYDAKYWLAKIGGIIIILFGLHMTGLFRIKFLEYDLRPQTRVDQRRSYISSAFMGIFFSFGWSPCVGPILGSILTAIVSSGIGVGEGVKLLSAYSAGLAIPFLLAALGIGWLTTSLRKYRKAMHYIEIGMGGVMILVGILLFLGIFSTLARFGPFVNFGL